MIFNKLRIKLYQLKVKMQIKLIRLKKWIK